MNVDIERAIDVARRRAGDGSGLSQPLSHETLNGAVGKIRSISRRRARMRVASRVAVAVLALGIGFQFFRAHDTNVVATAPTSSQRVVNSSGAQVHFADGSIATPLLPETTVEALSVSPTQVRVGLARGRARFDVVRMPTREFQVEAGDLRVVVLGTSFTLTRGERELLVEVHHGHVRVDGSGEARHLYGGQYASFQMEHTRAANQLAQVHSGTPSVSVQRSPSEPEIAVAPDLLPRRGVVAQETAGESLAELLEAADLARSAGRVDEAFALLTRGVQLHRNDPQLQAAMFTRARLLAETMHRPREAAEAFAEARALAPGGSLAEDALAREIEAWSALSDIEHVRERRDEYMRLYPNGVHRRAVERY